MKTDLYELIHSQGRVCLHCGAFRVNESLFCLSCEQRLWRVHAEVISFHESSERISGKALFGWYPDQDRMVSKLLLALKEGKARAAINYYATQFCSKIQPEKKWQGAILVPCPSAAAVDHASLLATSLSSILGIPMRPLLTRRAIEKGPQKRLSKAARFSLEMVALEKAVNQHVIFIDDIVTTGATAVAAKRALASEKGFEVWCLGRRYAQTALEINL